MGLSSNVHGALRGNVHWDHVFNFVWRFALAPATSQVCRMLHSIDQRKPVDGGHSERNFGGRDRARQREGWSKRKLAPEKRETDPWRPITELFSCISLWDTCSLMHSIWFVGEIVILFATCVSSSCITPWLPPGEIWWYSTSQHPSFVFVFRFLLVLWASEWSFSSAHCLSLSLHPSLSLETNSLSKQPLSRNDHNLLSVKTTLSLSLFLGRDSPMFLSVLILAISEFMNFDRSHITTGYTRYEWSWYGVAFQINEIGEHWTRMIRQWWLCDVVMCFCSSFHMLFLLPLFLCNYHLHDGIVYVLSYLSFSSCYCSIPACAMHDSPPLHRQYSHACWMVSSAHSRFFLHFIQSEWVCIGTVVDVWTLSSSLQLWPLLLS